MKNLTLLNDQSLTLSLRELVARERENLVLVLHHLNEVERRSLHLKEGYASMFLYCTSFLQYSESGAIRRIRVGRLLQKFPDLEGLLISGGFNLCTASLIYSVINEENKHEVLKATCGKLKREVEAYITQFQDPRKKKIADRILPIIVEGQSSNGSALSTLAEIKPCFVDHIPGGGTESSNGKSDGLALAIAPMFQPDRIEMVKLSFAAERDFIKKLDQARSLVSGKYPKGATLEEIFTEALHDLIDRRSPQKRQERRLTRASNGNMKGPDKKVSSAGIIRRNIPTAVRDKVFNRDNGKCSFISKDGHKCGSTWDLEIDHVQPYSLGGTHDLENLRLLCRAHNAARR